MAVQDVVSDQGRQSTEIFWCACSTVFPSWILVLSYIELGKNNLKCPCSCIIDTTINHTSLIMHYLNSGPCSVHYFSFVYLSQWECVKGQFNAQAVVFKPAPNGANLKFPKNLL